MTTTLPSEALPSEAMLSAISQGRYDALKEALAAGANPEFTRSESTPLMMAATRKNSAMVAALLEAKADPLRATRVGWTALHESARAGDLATIKILADAMWFKEKRDDDGWSALRAAIEARQVDASLALIEIGLNPNSRDGDGMTCLMAAVKNQMLDVVKVILKGNVDLSLKDESGRTVFSFAKDWPEGLAFLSSVSPSTTAGVDEKPLPGPKNDTEKSLEGMPSDQKVSEQKNDFSASGLSRIKKRSPA